MLRLYPLAVRGLLAWSARGTGATGFVALSGGPVLADQPAARVRAGARAQPGHLRRDGQQRHHPGRDRGVLARHRRGRGHPARARRRPGHRGRAAAIAAVRGVAHATAVWNTTWVTPFGQPVTVIAVDPASYAAVTAATPFPPLPAAPFGAAAPAARWPPAPPCRCSPRRPPPRCWGPGSTQLTSLAPAGPFSVRVAGILAETPAQPGGGAFVVMPQLHAARPGRPARAQHGPGQRPGDRRGPAVRRGQPGHPGRHDHLPLGGARRPDQLPAAARRRAHRRVHPGRGGRARPAGGDPGPGPRVGRARADPGPADRDGPRAR